MNSSKVPTFPSSLSGFGYHFNKDGELRHIETNETFQFTVKEGDHKYNQQHYEALGEIINEEIYSLLENRCGLKRLPVPKDCHSDETSSMIFVSDDYKSAEKLMVLIHGNGVVRAGQWARRLIINNSLDSGTQIPFIEEAKALGYGIVILNSNDNNRNGCPIRGNENPISHGNYVWRTYIEACAAAKIVIVAHSFGGTVTINLFQYYKSFRDRVVAVALTDSVHHLGNSSIFKPLLQISRNWVASEKTLDTPVKRANDIECVSAGCTQHEWTSWGSMQSIFKFLGNQIS